jgi:ABC-type multidrug transport system fused ATPase/permease subunit
VVLKDGRIVEHGSLETLLAQQGPFAAMYGSQEQRQEDSLVAP